MEAASDYYSLLKFLAVAKWTEATRVDTKGHQITGWSPGMDPGQEGKVVVRPGLPFRVYFGLFQLRALASA